MLTIPQAAGDDGRLFGSVTRRTSSTRSSRRAASSSTSRKVHLEQPIRTTGTHMVTVEVHEGVTAEVKTIITAE